MRRRLGSLLTLLTIAALGIALAGPASGAAGPTPGKTPVTFTIGMLEDVDSLNPFTGIVAESYEVWQTMYDTLTTDSAKDFTPTPSLASKWTTSPDGRTWTYTIRSGVKWSDGVPLTAADVAYTFNRIIKGSYEQTNYGSYVAGITSVTAPNATTVVMMTKAPSPIMTRLAVPILPEHIWSKVSESQVKSFKNEVGAVGSGPFVLTQRKVGQYIALKANPTYWGGAPHIDHLVYRVYGNADALAQALKKGEVDFADNLDADVWSSLKNTPGVTAYSAIYSGFDELAFNGGAALSDGTAVGNGNPALKDKRVRVALNYAIDRNTIVQRTLGGQGSVGTSIIPPIYPSLHYNPPSPYTFDLTKADQLLTAAGYPKAADGKRLTPAGKPLVLRLFARQESNPSQQAARLIQGWFEQLGITIKLDVIAEDNLTEQIGQGDYDMFEWGWVVEPDPDYQLSTFTCDKRSYKDGGTVYANLSDSFYCNPAYDALYAQQSTQIDPAQRAATALKMEQLLYDDAPYAVLYYYNDLQAYSTAFTGYIAQPTKQGALLFQYGAWTYLSVRPVGAKTAVAGGSSTGPIVTVVLVIAVLLLLAAGFWVRRRRRPGGNYGMDVE